MCQEGSKRKYRFALSFPGQYREFAEKVANLLCDHFSRSEVFYDEHHRSELGKHAKNDLRNIYRNDADLDLVFYGPKYLEKYWCQIEYEAITEMVNAAAENRHRVLYIKCEDCVLPDFDEKEDIFSDMRNTTALEIAQLAMDQYLASRAPGSICKYSILVFDDNKEMLSSIYKKLSGIFKDETKYEVSIDLAETSEKMHRFNMEKDYDVYILDVADRTDYHTAADLGRQYGDKMLTSMINEKPNSNIIPKCYIISRLSPESVAYQFYDTNRNNTLTFLEKGESCESTLAKGIKNYLFNDYIHTVTIEDKCL